MYALGQKNASSGERGDKEQTQGPGLKIGQGGEEEKKTEKQNGKGGGLKSRYN